MIPVPSRLLRVEVVVAIAWLLSACGKPAGLPPSIASDQPRVVEWKPGPELTRLDAALSFKLDRDMVSVDAVGPVLELPPVAVTPALPLRVHWQDRRTLHVQPETSWRAGQRYRVRLVQSGALERMTEPREFTFDVLPLHLQHVGLPRVNVPRKPAFDAWFNLPVRIAQAAQRCILAGGNGQRVALAARLAEQAPPGTTTGMHVQFDAQAALPLSTHFVLDCAGLTPADGDAPWRMQPGAAGWTTHGPLQAAATWPTGGRAEPPERAELCLELTTPVSSEQLARHVQLTPAPEGVGEGWYEGRCNPDREDDEEYDERATDRANSVLLAPRRHYKVTIAAGLTDVFGQQLGKTTQWEFDTADRLPGLWTATGAAEVLEAGRSEHAAGTLNLASAELRCLPLTAAQLATAYTGITGWIYQGGYVDPDTGPAPSPWQLLGLAPRSQVMDATAVANQARTLPLDLGTSCRGGHAAPGKPGLYALELVAKTPAGGGALQGDVPARMLANVTDLALLSKRGARSGLVWVSRLATGALVEGAGVEWIDAQGRLLARAASDARGLARFPRLPPVNRGELVAVRVGDDVAVVGDDAQWGDGLRSWQLGVREAHPVPGRGTEHLGVCAARDLHAHDFPSPPAPLPHERAAIEATQSRRRRKREGSTTLTLPPGPSPTHARRGAWSRRGSAPCAPSPRFRGKGWSEGRTVIASPSPGH